MKVKLIDKHEKYAITEDGRVYSRKTHNYLTPYCTGKYLCVKLDGQNMKIHRLVANAFIPNPDNKPEVDHIDQNPFNCHVDNLRWVTKIENAENMKSNKKVRCIEMDKEFVSIGAAARWLKSVNNGKGSTAGISNCCNGHTLTCGGYSWEFVKDETKE